MDLVRFTPRAPTPHVHTHQTRTQPLQTARTLPMHELIKNQG